MLNVLKNKWRALCNDVGINTIWVGIRTTWEY